MASLSIIADDLGLAVPVNDGILFLLKEKKINGVSILPTGAAFLDAVEKLKAITDASVGVHLTLVEEASILLPGEIRSLIGLGGRFYRNHRIFFIRYVLGLIKLSDIEKELRAQVQRCREAGIAIQFLNSHQHLHLLPGIMNVVIRLAKEFHIPYIRVVKEPISGRPGSLSRKLQALILKLLSWRAIPHIRAAHLQHNEVFVGFLNAGTITQEDINIAKLHAHASVELNCHPGHEDSDLHRRYNTWGGYHWEEELKLLQGETDKLRN